MEFWPNQAFEKILLHLTSICCKKKYHKTSLYVVWNEWVNYMVNCQKCIWLLQTIGGKVVPNFSKILWGLFWFEYELFGMSWATYLASLHFLIRLAIKEIPHSDWLMKPSAYYSYPWHCNRSFPLLDRTILKSGVHWTSEEIWFRTLQMVLEVLNSHHRINKFY